MSYVAGQVVARRLSVLPSTSVLPGTDCPIRHQPASATRCRYRAPGQPAACQLPGHPGHRSLRE